MQINYDGTNYWLYISADNPTCFICKKEGHLAKQCSSSVQTTNQPEQNTSQANIRDGNFDNRGGTKRLLPSSSCSKDSDSQNLSTNDIESNSDIEPNPVIKANTKKPTKKKVKTAATEIDVGSLKGIDEVLLPVKDMLQSSTNPYVLNYEQFKEFIANAAGNNQIASLTSSYTKDFTAVIKMLRETYPKFKERAIKNRITRVIKKLEDHSAWAEEMSSGTEQEQTTEQVHPTQDCKKSSPDGAPAEEELENANLET